MSEFGPGQHATSPKYVRGRRNAEAITARAEKKEQRPRRARAPKPPKPETAAQKFEKAIKTFVGAFRERHPGRSEARYRHDENLIRAHAIREAGRSGPERGPTQRPVRRWKRRIRERIARRSRARNRR